MLRQFRRSLFFALATVILGCADSTSPKGTPITGNVTERDFESYTSVGFVLDRGTYHYFAVPQNVETTIASITADGTQAFGWSRTAEGQDGHSFLLDLRTRQFTPLRPDGLDWFVVRGANDHGLAVGLGKSRARQQTVGVVYNTQTRDVTEIQRPGYTQGGLTGINNDGVIVGYSAFGEVGFVYRAGTFTTLTASGAGRIFPTAITNQGKIVGLWGPPENWWDPGRGFFGNISTSGYVVHPYDRRADVATSLTAINDHGTMAGIYYPSAGASGIVFTTAASTAVPIDHPLPSSALDPWVSGIDDKGRVFGSVTIKHTPNNPDECGGHGHLHGTRCHCDTGYKLDPTNEGNCIPA